MATILQISLCLHKLKRSMIYLSDCFLPKKVMFPLAASLNDGICLLIVSAIFRNNIRECITMIGHQIPLLGENCTNSIVIGIYLNLKWLL